MLIQLETQSTQPKPRSVFYSYSHKDEELRDELDSHLKLLKRDGFISTWHDRKIKPGDEWDHVINENLNSADVILFLVSHHFLASQYCRDIEVKRAMERYQNHEAILIPIIIKPCVWTSEEFAKLQVLPKNCRPLAEWPDSGFAQVAEDLRTMLVDMLFPQKPDEATGGQHGNWIIKLRSREEVDSKVRAQQVVERLREYTADFSISLQATASTQIVDGEKTQIGLMLILTGTPEAFSVLDKAQQNGQLSSAIDSDILSLYIAYGATVQGSSAVISSLDIAEIEGRGLLLNNGKKVIPPYIKALLIPKNQSSDLNFIMYSGNTNMKTGFETELIDYFQSALVTNEKHYWVNLSAYEADRMLPQELSGTKLGRGLLEQDCVLKRLTASLMHPDTPTGREYWDAVYSEARRIFGTSKMPFNSFQKVWLVPKDAQVYEIDGDTFKGEPLFGITPGTLGAIAGELSLDVKCESDLIARSHATALVDDLTNYDFTIDLFREIILPRIVEEVNEGEYFMKIRQIYNAIVLASWAKNNSPNFKQLSHIFNCGDTKNSKFTIKSISKEENPLKVLAEKKNCIANELSITDHLFPNDPAFKVPENVEFFNQYIRLFKDGIFRCARNEAGDRKDEHIIRVYFSGAIDFRNLKDVFIRKK
jgi:hypothetical protein